MCTHDDDKPAKRNFTCSHVLCYISDGLMDASVTVSWVHTASASILLLDGRHSNLPHTMNQPAKSDAYALTASGTDPATDSTKHFPWHGTSFQRSTSPPATFHVAMTSFAFTRSTIHIHVNVARHPSHSSRPPLTQAFSHVRAEVAFQSTASVVPRAKNSVPKSAVFSNVSTPVDFHLSIHSGLLQPETSDLNMLEFPNGFAIRNASCR